MTSETKKQSIKMAAGSVPVAVLILIYNTMEKLTDSVQKANESLIAMASQVQRNTRDIEYQQERYDRDLLSIQKLNEILIDVKRRLESLQK